MTLTKAKFLEQTKKRVELVKDVPGFGDVWIRDVGEVQRSRRVSRMFDANGQRIPNASDRRRLYEVIDQVSVDAKGSPMFTEEDLTELEDIGSARLDPLYMAISSFNEGTEKNGQAAQNGSSGN